MISRVIETIVRRAQRRRISRQFQQHMGHGVDFENPRTYQEKIQFRKLYGNHDFYGLVADKFRARAYVESKVGKEHLIPLLGAYDRLHKSVFDTLPNRFIIKANHGCKWHKIVHDKSTLDVAKTVRWFNTLMQRRYGRADGERHYNFIPPKIIIEELLEGPLGGSPWDYCFFCYRGPEGFDYNFAITTPTGKSASFGKEWELRTSSIPEQELAAHIKPANFDAMVRIARDISVEFDFVRVDLYTVQGKVYFGEITCTPHSGYGLIADPAHQRMRDEMWHLDSANPRLYKPPRSHRFASPANRRHIDPIARTALSPEEMEAT